jgi:hypothetical protein
MEDAKLTQRIEHIKQIMEKNEKVINGNKVLLFETQKMLRAKVEELNTLSSGKTKAKGEATLKTKSNDEASFSGTARLLVSTKSESVANDGNTTEKATGDIAKPTAKRVVRRVQRADR